MKSPAYSRSMASAETSERGGMDLQEGHVTANGLDFAYLESGSGPLALCLHGFPDSPDNLPPSHARPGPGRVPGGDPFMRGFAPTAIPADGSYTIPDLLHDANGLHEALGGDGDAVIIAHDWGAVVAWGAPVHAPERWSKVVIANIPPSRCTPKDIRLNGVTSL